MKELATAPVTEPRWPEYKTLARSAGVLATGVVAGMLVSQLDRIVLSGALDASAYGSYVIVANLGVAFMQLQYPLMRAFFPRVVLAVKEQSDTKGWLLATMVVALCVAPCLVVALAAPWILQTWLSNPQVALAGVAPLRLILIAVAINAVYHLIYQRMLALGANHVVVRVNVVVLVLVSLFLYFDAPIHGAVAGGFAWVLSASLQLLMGSWWLFSRSKIRG
jgi:O-antigen/teichoic acid export membrane protein